MVERTMWLTPNDFSRPGHVLGAVIHWFENPGQSAEGCWEYFEERKNGKLDYGGANDLLGLLGEVIHAIPYTERTHHVGSEWYRPEAVALFGPRPNWTTLGVEWAHPDWTGKPLDQTYASGVVIYARMSAEFEFDPLTRIVTHSFITGKETPRGHCHKWFYDNPDKLDEFRHDVKDRMSRGG